MLQLLVLLFAAYPPMPLPATGEAYDIALLKSAGLPDDGPSLVEHLKRRTPDTRPHRQQKIPAIPFAHFQLIQTLTERNGRVFIGIGCGVLVKFQYIKSKSETTRNI
jgi:hypothetical protein